MWRHHLQSEGVRSLYFNAWETDFSSDPLIALIGELSVGIDAFGIDPAQRAGIELKKLKKVGARVAARAVPALVKAGTLGLLDLSEVTEEVLASAAEKIAEDEIKRYEESRDSIRSFRAALEDFALKVSGSDDAGASLVIIVDELDRCRPDYAIRVLETVKHLFSVPGVLFVVATDTRQLSNSIRHVYGLEAAAEDYLRRFFDLSLALPTPSTRQFVQAQLENYDLEGFFKSRSHPELQYDKAQVISAFVAMFGATGCSLRDQQKCFTLLALSLSGVGENSYLHPLLLCPLIVLKVKRNVVYQDFVDGLIDAEELVRILSENLEGRKFFDSDRGYGDIVRAYLIAAMPSRERREGIIAKYEAEVAAGSNPSPNRRVLEAYKHYSFRHARSAMQYVLPRIELFARQGIEAEQG